MFRNDKTKQDGLERRCKDCARLSNKRYLSKLKTVDPNRYRARGNSPNRRFNRYGITRQAYEKLLLEQEGKCAICKQKSDRTLDIDHCHSTGIVRGLLCNACNKAIGLLRNDPRLCANASLYLAKENT